MNSCRDISKSGSGEIEEECDLWTDDPCDSPAGKSEALGKTVDDQDVVFVDIFDVLSGRNGSTIAIAGVVVSTIKLIHDKCRSVTADILDLSELGVLYNFASGVAGV